MKLLKLFVIFIPIFLFPCGGDEYFAQLLAEKIREEKYDECFDIVEYWEKINPHLGNKALGIKAAIYFSKGDISQGSYFMSFFINGLSEEEKADPIMNFIIMSYNKGVAALLLSSSNKITCRQVSEYEQPPGVKTRYWLGVGQMLGGLALMPFNPVAGGSLFSSGAYMFVDAACDAWDNKTEFERNLQERQKANPDFQNNSFVQPTCRKRYLVEAV